MKSDIRLNGTLACLISVQVCLNGAMAGLRMAAPLLSLRRGYSTAAVGILLALFAFIQLFLAIPAGRYADRHNLRRPIGFCTGVSVLGVGLVAVWPTFPMLCVAALLTGGANGVSVITLQRHAGRLANDPIQLKQVFSWLAIAPSIANFVGPFLAGLVIDHAGFRACFATHGGVGAALLVAGPQFGGSAQGQTSGRGGTDELLGFAGRAAYATTAAGQLAVDLLLGRSYLCVAGSRVRAGDQRIGDRGDPRRICHCRHGGSAIHPGHCRAIAGMGSDHGGHGEHGGALRDLSPVAIAAGDGPVFRPARVVARVRATDGHECPAPDYARRTARARRSACA